MVSRAAPIYFSAGRVTAAQHCDVTRIVLGWHVVLLAAHRRRIAVIGFLLLVMAPTFLLGVIVYLGTESRARLVLGVCTAAAG